MEKATSIENEASVGKTIVTGPLGEALYYSDLPGARQRRELFEVSDAIFNAIEDPNMDFDEALQKGIVDRDTLNKFYNGLSDFFESDDNNVRLLLYLPFQAFPNLNNDNAEILESSRRLGQICQDGYIRLLHDFEPRANFTNGDVLEPGLLEPEVISKVGHLTAEVLAKGIILEKDIVDLMDIISNPGSLKSLAEGTMVAKDRGLISDEAFTLITQIIKDKLPGVELGAVKFNEASFVNVSEERKKWLKKDREEKELDLKAIELSETILALDISAVDFTVSNFDSDYWKIATLAIFKAGELLFNSGEGSAEISAKSYTLFKRLLDDDNPKIRDIIESGINHWVRRGIVTSEYSQSLGIKVLDLSSPTLFEASGIAKEFDFIEEATEIIKKDALLSKSLYPVFLVFGSRIKGYADTGSDYDLAMFFRPEAKSEEREQILARLNRLVTRIGFIDKIREYWLEEQGGKLSIKNISENEMANDYTQVHFVFGGAWVGGEEEVHSIQNDLLEQYLSLSDSSRQDLTRGEYLKRLELDVLQFRLLHKGFKKLYPSAKKQGTKNSDLIDWDSDFWDPGFRRVATKLFLSRVFLPQTS